MAVGATALVILGASGDLAKRKLIPALSELFTNGEIDQGCAVIGSGRTAFTHEEFKERFAVTDEFKKILYYHEGIRGLSQFIRSIGSFREIIIFMALPPHTYAATASELHAEGLTEGTRLIIEKPFGYDVQSARSLNESLSQYYTEEQIFRIDHYLAKEAVQNLLVFRFANSLFEPIWNSRYIESVQIQAFETQGIGARAAYFDKAGILRDMVQNHLMQLLCLTLMEPPVSLRPEDIRDAKLNVLKNLMISSCVKGQYRGYRDEPGVDKNSNTETYAELTAFVHNFRWTGMPIHIRTGKAMDRAGTEIGIRFKPLPDILYNTKRDLPENSIIFKIQPSEGIVMNISGKVPGSDIQIAPTSLKFCYRDAYGDDIPEAYRRLLLDALKGDHTLFVSAEETERSWAIIGPFLEQGEIALYDRGVIPGSTVNWINFDAASGCSDSCVHN